MCPRPAVDGQYKWTQWQLGSFQFCDPVGFLCVQMCWLLSTYADRSERLGVWGPERMRQTTVWCCRQPYFISVLYTNVTKKEMIQGRLLDFREHSQKNMKIGISKHILDINRAALSRKPLCKHNCLASAIDYIWESTKARQRPYPDAGHTEDSTQHILPPDWVL